ncbi:MAG: thiamine phosphate synthase [Acidimicrobiales bacterium]
MAEAGPSDKLAGRRLYLCTADRPDLGPFLAACIRGGVDLVQLRDKHLQARPLLRRASVAIDVCRRHGVPFILNDRPDLALACGADGVHVGQDDVPPAIARRILGPDALVGRSTHAPEELVAALAEPVDYLSAGPVTPTPTKPGRPGTGLGYLRQAARLVGRDPGEGPTGPSEAAEIMPATPAGPAGPATPATPAGAAGPADRPLGPGHIPRPWFVTGGVTPTAVAEMAAAGATRFVVVRYLTEAEDPEGNARTLAESIDQAVAASRR